MKQGLTEGLTERKNERTNEWMKEWHRYGRTAWRKREETICSSTAQIGGRASQRKWPASPKKKKKQYVSRSLD